MDMVLYVGVVFGVPLAVGSALFWGFCKLTGRECPFEW